MTAKSRVPNFYSVCCRSGQPPAQKEVRIRSKYAQHLRDSTVIGPKCQPPSVIMITRNCACLIFMLFLARQSSEVKFCQHASCTCVCCLSVTGELQHRTMWQITVNLKMSEENWTLPYCDHLFPACLRRSVENPRLKGGVLKRK